MNLSQTSEPSTVTDVVLREWSTTEASFQLSDTAVSFLENRVNGEKTRVSVSFDRDGRATFHSRQFVGVVSLPSGPTIRIQPKAAGNNLLYLVKYAQDVHTTTFEHEADLTAGDSFIDAFAALFVHKLDVLRREGYHNEYQTRKGTEKYIRGRIDLQQQLQRQGMTPTRFECTYETLTTDTIANQAILYAGSVLERLTSDDDIAQALQWRVSELRKQVTLRPVQARELAGVEITRLNDHYADLLRLVEPVLRNTFVKDLSDAEIQSFSLMVNMNRVFEAVIERLAESVARTRPDVTTQPQARTTNLITGQPTVEMYPDVVLEAGQNTSLVSDAKWKTGSISNSDIYQLVSYVYAHDAPGLLIYPEQNGDVATEYRVNDSYSIDVFELPTNTSCSSYEEYIAHLEESFAAKYDDLTAMHNAR